MVQPGHHRDIRSPSRRRPPRPARGPVLEGSRLQRRGPPRSSGRCRTCSCTQPQAARRPKSASRKRGPVARSTLRIASRAFSISNSPSASRPNCFRSRSRRLELPADVANLARASQFHSLLLVVLGQVFLDGVEHLALGLPLGLVLGLVAAAAKSMPRKSRASNSTPSSLPAHSAKLSAP